MIAWHKKTADPTQQQPAASTSADGQPQQVEQNDGEVIIGQVGKAVTAITSRLTSLSTFDGTESKVSRTIK